MRKEKLNSEKVKILVCCHKECELPVNDIFLPIQVGAAIADRHWGIQRDDQLNGDDCDNISSKNKSYCELTAMYWAWKNIKKLYPELEYIGLNHYRRFFAFDKSVYVYDKYILPDNFTGRYILNEEKLSKILNKNQTIIAKKEMYPYSLENHYKIGHVSDDYNTLESIVETLYPEYKNSFISVMTNTNALAEYNMAVMKWDDFNSYCTWLFDVLFETEKRINISNYSDIQKRIFGYMGERLFNVWLFHNNIKTKEMPVYWFCDKEKTNFIKYTIKNFRRNAAFFISLNLKMRIKNLLMKVCFKRQVIERFRK